MILDIIGVALLPFILWVAVLNLKHPTIAAGVARIPRPSIPDCKQTSEVQE